MTVFGDSWFNIILPKTPNPVLLSLPRPEVMVNLCLYVCRGVKDGDREHWGQKEGEETFLSLSQRKARKDVRRGHTGLMSVWALTGDVVINYIFIQGREGESVNW